MKKTVFILIGCLSFANLAAQQILTLDQMIAEALSNNESIRAAKLEIDHQKQRKQFASDIGRTNVQYVQGQINGYVKNDYNLSISQNIPFPSLIGSRYALGREQIKGAEFQEAATENTLAFQVKQAFYSLMYLQAKEVLLKVEDSIYTNFVRESELRYRSGKTHLLEKVTAESEQNEIQNRLALTAGRIISNRRLLQTLLNSDHDILTAETELTERKLVLGDNKAVSNNPDLALLKQQIEIADQERKVAGNSLLPGFNVGFFTQTLIGSPLSDAGGYAESRDHFRGFQIGLNIPLWYGPQLARVKAAKTNRDLEQSRYAYREDILKGEWERAVHAYLMNKTSLDYYKSSALKSADLILDTSQPAYAKGEIDYSEFWLSIQQAVRIRESYLDALNEVNQSVVKIEYLSGLVE